MSEWKQKHASDCDAAVGHDLVKKVIDEFLMNIRATDDALVRYGCTKIATYAAQVARAQALGFDPNLLRLDPAAANEELMKLAQLAVESGKPIVVIQGGA